MMKKISRIAALLAATAFLLAGIPACSDEDDGDGDPTLTAVEIAVADTVQNEYKVGEKLNWEGVTVTAKYSDGKAEVVTDKVTIEATYEEAEFTTATAGTFDVTLTATYEGKTATKTCEITVKAEESVIVPGQGGGSGEGGGDNTGDGSGGGNGGTGGSGNTTATVKYLQPSNTANSSSVTPDWAADVSDTSLVTASDLIWTLPENIEHKQWDIKVNNNGVTEAQLEEQTTGMYAVGTELANVSFTITAVKALKLKTISAITSSGKTPNGISCYIGNEKKATGVQYSDEAAKAFKLSDASLDDYAVAAGETVTIKITCDKTIGEGKITDAKVDFGQIILTVEG